MLYRLSRTSSPWSFSATRRKKVHRKSEPADIKNIELPKKKKSNLPKISGVVIHPGEQEHKSQEHTIQKIAFFI